MFQNQATKQDLPEGFRLVFVNANSLFANFCSSSISPWHFQ